MKHIRVPEADAW